MININIHFGQCVLQEGGSMLLVSRAKLHKAQGKILAISMFLATKHGQTYKSIMIAFAERLSVRVSICTEE